MVFKLFSTVCFITSLTVFFLGANMAAALEAVLKVYTPFYFSAASQKVVIVHSQYWNRKELWVQS